MDAVSFRADPVLGGSMAADAPIDRGWFACRPSGCLERYPDRVTSSFNNILVDAGDAALSPDLGGLVPGLAAAGVAPGDIASVLMIHLHVDRVGALLTDGRPTGPVRGQNLPPGLHDQPVLVVDPGRQDPGRHTARIWRADADAAGRFSVTASDDKTVRVWSLADGRLL